VNGQALRRIILEQSKRANVGHIGCALSVAEILACLFGQVLRIETTSDPDRDRFVLSKGHAALALYAALFLQGRISRQQLDSYCADDSLLGVHPEHELRGVDFSTGSLGLGFAMAAGAALAARLQQSRRRVFALLSDAECNEGSVWETAMFAAHHHLSNLTAIIDLNGQQALGRTSEVMNLSNLAERWQAFEWRAEVVNGHDEDALAAAMNSAQPELGRPRVVIARTIFGKGVSFMENQVRWHYLPMTDREYQQALEEIEAAA